jgi:hypothetical protein
MTNELATSVRRDHLKDSPAHPHRAQEQGCILGDPSFLRAATSNALSFCDRGKINTKVVFLSKVLSLPTATFFSLFVGSVHGAPLNCEDWNEHTPNQVCRGAHRNDAA